MSKISGQDFIDLGFKPGKWFKEALEYANQHKLSGETLRAYLQSVKPTYLEPFREPISYYKNIKAETADEEANVAAVTKSMDLVMQTPNAVTGAIMPDACPAGPVGQIPVGGVAVMRNGIHPAMHSADICCSVMATNLGFIEPKKVLDTAHSLTHFGGGGQEAYSQLPKEFEREMAENYFLRSDKALELARHHLATQGDGNHFLFVGQSSQTGETYMVTHHGSRGLGAYLYKKGMDMADYFRREISPNTSRFNGWIPYDTEEGEAYWQALQLVRQWTKLNHQTLHDETARALRIDYPLQFWNEHNFVFKEGDLFYHAKGATPLSDHFVPDSYEGLRLVPLNMREPVLIVKGETSENNLGFAPHGAGRNLSRTQHKKRHAQQSEQAIFERETQGLDVRFYSDRIDISELPSAYKDAETVKEQMQAFNLGSVVDEIIPYGCIMAGDWEYNAPWRRKARAKWEKKNR